ncbi:MAG: DMT family transporter [Chlamydiota bacterium]|nr:DMT family transporter [Chlamydiota bacterium]
MQINFSLLYMIGAAFFFAVMGACVRFASTSIPIMEIVFFRSFIGLIIVIPLMVIRKRSFLGSSQSILVIRGLTGFVALSNYFLAISMIPLATAVMLNYTSPLFIALLAPLLLRERFDYHVFWMIVIGFVGVICIVKPVIDVSLVGAGIGLLSGMFAAFAYMSISAAKKKGNNSLTIIFYFMVISSILSFPFMVYHFQMPNMTETIYIVGLSICATIAQILMTKAYHHGKTASTSAYSSMIIIFAFIFGMIFWHEIPTLWSVAGGCLIFISIVYIAHRESRMLLRNA